MHKTCKDQDNFAIILFLFLSVLTTIEKKAKLISKSEIKTNANILAGLLIVILLLSSAASAAEQLKVSTSRYSIFAPWEKTSLYNFNLSANFTAFALHLDNGLPVNGTNITFEIYANGSSTPKATLYNLTQQNGLASVSYNAASDFTNKTDTDYGNWTITAYVTGTQAVTGSTNMSITIGGNMTSGINSSTGAIITCGSSTSRGYCHKITIINAARYNATAGGNYPQSPYTGGYGQDKTFVEAAHLFSSHSNSSWGGGCFFCHPGYSANNTGYGYTNDVHRNRTCDFCHGDWTYIKASFASGGGAGIPKMPSCYGSGCHPQYNYNLTNISTLADLTAGPDANVTGKNISVYSYNFDTKAPLTAHNGTNSSLIASVPCVVCHGPAHNISKPDPSVTNNTITESSHCISCHGQKHAAGTNCTDCHTQDAHAIIKPNTTNCIGCHDTGGISTIDIDFASVNNSESVHRTLNFNDSNSITRNNSECWGCHGDGDATENAQPSAGHPLNYKSPKNCNNNICHSVSQSTYNETMIYSHFQNASLNNNPNNITNYNITASEQCQNCHINSIVTDDSNSNLSKVSHYASKKELIDSFNCVYCHLNKDNSEDWGNATLIKKDRVGTIEVNKEDNNITLFQGQTVYLGEGYSVKLIEISALRGDAFINILNKDVIVDQVMVRKNDTYTYERMITIDNATFKTPAVTIRINSIFTGTKDSFIIFEATRPRKLHTEKESKDSACFACHMYRYSTEKERYKVIDREAKDDRRDIIYYTSVLLDHKLENKSKIYFNDEDYVFNQLGIMDKFISVPTYQKYLEDGQTWQIADKYSLKFKASSMDRQAWLEFMIDNKTVEDHVVTAGSLFDYYTDIRYKEYTDTNMTIFTANVSSVFLGQKDFIILKDSELLSTQILKTTANTTQFGYNNSWLHPGDRFTLGKIPENLHTPNLFDNAREWADCVRCHDSSKNLRISQIDAISSRLGKHSILNAAAPDNAYMSDSIDKACLACHTDGTEPNTHSPTYVIPRNCPSCHTYQDRPTYGAKNISDEPHGYFSACESCHMPKSHEIVRPEILPSISEANLSRAVINIGESVKLIAKAAAGIGMKIRSAEYFIDTKGNPGYGIPLKPVDGVFDFQIEQVVAEINSTNISLGTHIIYIHAMERDNRWGEFYSVNFTIVSDAQGAGQTKKNAAALDSSSIIISLMVVYLIISKRGYNKFKPPSFRD